MTIPKQYDPKIFEPKMRELWNRNQVYRYNPHSKKACFSIDTPPPYVSSSHLHAGHAMSYTQAEIIVRFKRMQGYEIYYPMGFDDNGLPTERFVEKKYRVSRNNISRKEFIALCLQETAEGIRVYRRLWNELGISVDWSLSYSTIDKKSQRTAQKSFIDLFRKGLIQRRSEPGLWCIHCATSLAQADLEAYECETELYDIPFFPNNADPLIISTTRPELIPACVALFFHPDDERYQYLHNTQVIAPISGHTVPILTHSSVDPLFGTGLMMVCTWGDSEDVEKWRDNHLETRVIMNSDGKMNDLAGPVAGMHIQKARKFILNLLSEKNQILNSRKLTHFVNTHERCGNPVEFIQSPQWFIRILDFKDEFLKRGEELEWNPEFMKTRFDHWVNGLKWDWCISRQRFYGVPFPVWYCDDCGDPVIPPENILPVDPGSDAIPPGLECPCGSRNLKGETDVMDTWMTSSTTPLIISQWVDQNPNSELFSNLYPQSVRVQGFEIIRTWLFYSIVKSHFHTNSLPWKRVMISGWGLDSNGKKMSKRDGNFVDPMAIINKYSADALRYWSAGATLGQNLRYSESDVKAGRRLQNKLWNAARLIHHQLTESGGFQEINPGKPSLMDRWITSQYRKMFDDVTMNLEKFDFRHAIESLEQFFFQCFCDEYLEIVKDRFWHPDNHDAGTIQAARFILHHLLLDILKLYAPFVPYITDSLYQLLFRDTCQSTSIHITSWPETNEFQQDQTGNQAGEIFRQIVTQIRKWKSDQHLHSYTALRRVGITCNRSRIHMMEGLRPDLCSIARAENIEIIENPVRGCPEADIALTFELHD